MQNQRTKVQRQMRKMLSLNRRRKKYLCIFACLAVLVSVFTSLSLMRIGITKTHDVRELDCPITAPVAHHHTSDCYDAHGNLVCRLPEREPHTHDDSCYEERTYLICGQATSDEHEHTDACYRTERVLTCGKQECATEHAHSDLCFRTVAVDDETGARYQVLSSEIKEPDPADKSKSRVALAARADVPEGVLPSDASLKAERPGASEADQTAASAEARAATDAALAAVARELGEGVEASVAESVALSFVAPGDAKPEAPCDVTYRLTSDAIAKLDPARLRVAAIDAKTGQASLVGSAHKVVPESDANKSVDPSDPATVAASSTVELRARGISALVVLDVDPDTAVAPAMPAASLAGTTGTGTSVIAEAPEGALPEGATMGIADVPAAQVARLVEAAESDSGREAVVSGASAVDVRFFDASGEPVEPAVPVALRLFVPGVEDMRAPRLYLLPGGEPGSQASPMASSLDPATGAAAFEAAACGSYAVADVSYASGAELEAKGESWEVSVSYGADARIPEGATLSVSEIPASDASHDDYVSAAREALGLDAGTPTYQRLLDISIMSGGKKVQPAEGATVDVRIELADASSSELDVVHFPDGEAECDVVPNVVTEAPVAGVSEEEGRAVSFATTGFSTYAIIADAPQKNYQFLDGGVFAFLLDGMENGTQSTWVTVAGTGHQSANGRNYIDFERHANADRTQLGEDITTATSTFWFMQLVPGTTDQFYISVASTPTEQNIGKYLNFVGNDDSDGGLVLSDTPQAIRVGTTDDSGRVRFYATTGQQAGTLDLDGNSLDKEGFFAWTTPGYFSSSFTLYRPEKAFAPDIFAVETVRNVNDQAGVKATLESDPQIQYPPQGKNYYGELAASAFDNTGNYKLGQDRTFWQITYVSAADPYEGGLYTMKAVGGENDGKYLSFQYDETLDNARRYKLVMSETPQVVRLTTKPDEPGWGEGVVLISHPSDFYSVDLYNGYIIRGFGVWQQDGGNENRRMRLVSVQGGFDLYGLDGKSYALVNTNLGNKPNAILTDVARNDGTRLEAYTGIVDGDYLKEVKDRNGNESVEIPTWTFEAVEEDKYRLKTKDGKYLNMSANALWVSDTPQTFQVVVGGFGEHKADFNGKVSIISLPEDTGGMSYSVNVYGWNYDQGFFPYAGAPHWEMWNGPADWFTLYDVTKLEQQFYADAVSVAASMQEVEPGDEVLVYKMVTNPTTGDPELYAITGDGSLVQVWAKGNEIRGTSTVSPYWTLTENGGVRSFRNSGGTPDAGDPIFPALQVTNNYLAPAANDAAVSQAATNVGLPGRDDNTYASFVQSVATGANSPVGFYIEFVNGVATLKTEEIPANLSEQERQKYLWTFANVKRQSDPVDPDLKTVDTIDSKSLGVTIKMYDFLPPAALPGTFAYAGDDLHNLSDALSGATYFNGGYYNNSGLAGMVLGDDGFPLINVVYDSATQSYSYVNDPLKVSDLFNGTHRLDMQRTGDGTYVYTGNEVDNYLGEANHLFLKEPYDAFGYFTYSSFNNFAKWKGSTNPGENTDSVYDFDVYEALGAPYLDGYEDDDAFWRSHGNFFPYDTLFAEKPCTQNLYDGSGNPLDWHNPLYQEDVYGFYSHYIPGTQGSYSAANRYFGMTCELDFMMAEGGYYKGLPMIYDFTGDDDLWVYVDNVKLLDIGGYHDCLSGKIDFSTGQITYETNAAGQKADPATYPGMSDAAITNLANGESAPWATLPTTIKQAYQMAGLFPDGTAWDNAKVDNYFNGDTYKDFTAHTFKMIYVEHGDGPSDLDFTFNLPAAVPGSFEVEKELDDATLDEYGDREFEYQVFLNETSDPLTRAYDDTTQAYTGAFRIGNASTNLVQAAELLDENGDPAGELPINAQGIFKLKAGQKVRITLMSALTPYYVQEVNVPDDVNRVDVYGASGQGDPPVIVSANRPAFPWPASGDVSGWGANTVPNDATHQTGASTPADQPLVKFVNTMDDAPLEIEKQVAVGEPVEHAYFRFRLWLEGDDGSIELADDVPYTLWTKQYLDAQNPQSYQWVQEMEDDGQGGQRPRTYYTGTNGIIELQADQKAVISHLMRGTKYVVIEDGMPANEYAFKGIASTNNGTFTWEDFTADENNNGWATYGKAAYGAEGAHAYGTTKAAAEASHSATELTVATNVTATNDNGLSLKLFVVDGLQVPGDELPTDPDAYIGDGHFKLEYGRPLYRWTGESDDDPLHDDPQLDANGDIADGCVVADYEWTTLSADATVPKAGYDLDAKSGIYRLTETRAPAGHLLPDPVEVCFKLKLDDTNKVIGVEPCTSRGGQLTPEEQAKVDKIMLSKSEYDATSKEYRLTLAVANIPGAELPHAGGLGTRIFTLAGTLVCAGATLVYAHTYKRRYE